MVSTFYSELFKPDTTDPNISMDILGFPHLQEDHYHLLHSLISPKEIKKAVFDMATDDACSSTGTGLERMGSLGWAKEASGRDWRMPDRLWRDRITAC